MANSVVTNKKGKGIFKRDEWIKESKSLYLSAKMLRSQGDESKRKFSDANKNDKSIYELIDIATATDKSSRLLLGYAFELLLKSAVLLMNYGATENTISQKFKFYSHDLLSMIKDLELSLSDYDLNLLDLLSQDIVQQAREGANKQVISSQADSLIKISRIWADFFPANTSNQPI
ncbi:hypothetical protein RH801_004058 [Citrobacter freundii]|nr:hypothetical protein [Citrobacter freundii]